MIFSEEQTFDMAMETMLAPEGKSCANCHWGEAHVPKEKQGEWTTCGHHHDNFQITSLCGYWTNPNNTTLKKYMDKRKKEILDKIKKP